MSAIILMNADDADLVNILEEDDTLGNMVFPSVEDADMWLQKNARVGWCTRIIGLAD